MSVATINSLPSVTVSIPQPMPYMDQLDIPAHSDITPKQQVMASCTGAILTSLFMTPLDVVKIRLQAQQKPFQSGTCFIYSNGLMDCLCVCSQCTESNRGQQHITRSNTNTHGRPWYVRPGQFTGTLDAFVKISRNEGIRTLWSGLPPTLFQSVPATVVYFTIYDRFKYALGYDESNPKTKYIPMVAGSSARVVSATLISPIELIRTNMQSKQRTYRQMGKAVRVSIANDGLLSMMRGLGPSLLRDVPFSAIYWFGYELCKAHQINETGSTELSFLETFLSGAISGTVAAIATLPFDVIKTHRQIELGEAFVSGGRKKVTSTWLLIAELYRRQGLGALYAGIVPRVIKVAPACAIMISTYEFGKSFFRYRNALEEMSTS